MQINSIHSSLNLSSVTGGVARYESKLLLEGFLTSFIVVDLILLCEVWNIADIFGSDFLLLSLIVKPGGHLGSGQVLIIAVKKIRIKSQKLLWILSLLTDFLFNLLDYSR